MYNAMYNADQRTQDMQQPLTYIPIITPAQAVRLLQLLGLKRIGQ